MSDRADFGDQAAATPLEKVHLEALLPAISAHSPWLANWLSEGEQRRLSVIFHVLTSPYVVPALNDAARWLDAIQQWSAESDTPPYSQLARRVGNDYRDGLEGMLTHRLPLVLDACRDLMEVTVLVRDFRREPQRLTKWMKTQEDERPRDFGFTKLAKKHSASEEGNRFMTADLDDFVEEYAAHSRTLHPAMWLTDETELTRESQAPRDHYLWAASMTYEIVKHTMAANLQLVLWLADRETPADPRTDDRDFDLPGDGIDLFFDHHEAFLESSGWSELADRAPRYSPRRKSDERTGPPGAA